MIKTLIENKAKEYASKLNHSMEAIHNLCPTDFEKTFTDGAKFILSLPLFDRLTDEEKNKVLDIRDKYFDYYVEHVSDKSYKTEEEKTPDFIAACRVLDCLDKIFDRKFN